MSNIINKKTLKKISNKYFSTKHSMGFFPIYEKYLQKFKKKKINILEIGVESGNSLKIWSDYFTKGKIVGLDIVKKIMKIKNTEIFCGSQIDEKILSKIVNKYKKFDIIIDDGSHVNKHVIKTFNFLFPFLSENGLYFIEDLQTSYMPNWGGDGVNFNNKKTTMNFIRSLADRIHYQDIDDPFYKRNFFDGKIGFIHIYKNICIIEKKINYYESGICYKNSWYLGLKKNRKNFNLFKIRDLKYYLIYFFRKILVMLRLNN
jgi:hypothetical protein